MRCVFSVRSDITLLITYMTEQVNEVVGEVCVFNVRSDITLLITYMTEQVNEVCV